MRLLGSTQYRTGLVSALLLIPCFWHSRIQAGDLSSHVYNAWLSMELEKGAPLGLWIATPWTNVLFDLILGALIKAVGFGAAQRIAVGFCVLVFFWGAFRLVSTVAGRPCSFLAPCLAMLAYGWTFHTGLFNFYLSMGLAMWALALASRRHTAARVGVLILAVLAILAHALPVLWAAAIGAYAWAVSKIPRRFAWIVPLAGLAAIAGAARLITALFPTYWSILQLISMTGVDQTAIFGTKYFAIALGLAGFWFLLFCRILYAKGLMATCRSVPFQIALFAIAAVALIPTRIELPGYKHALAFISERSSLIVGIAICAFAGALVANRFEKSVILLLAAVYFSFLYVDTRALNEFEDDLDRIVATLPPGQRVVSSIQPFRSNVNALAHTLDRACIGRCFSYANYELSTGQFRLRASADSTIVVPRYADSWAMQTGTYVVKQRDVPLYQVYLPGNNPRELKLRLLKAGEVSGNTWWQAPPFL